MDPFQGVDTAADLAPDLAAIAGESASDWERRVKAAARIQHTAQKTRERIKSDFLGRSIGGAETARRLSLLNDAIVRSSFKFVTDGLFPLVAPTTAEVISLAAVGGCGRGEMAPFSDVDLVFLTPHAQTSWGEIVIETTLYLLWDLKLKVGHATRSKAETLRLAREDITIRTSLLEMRWLAGDVRVFDDVANGLRGEIFNKTGSEFVAAKLDERKLRHRRHGGSRYLLEPNVKESKGGQRDLQTLFWLAKYLYNADNLDELVAQGVFTPSEAARCRFAASHLWSVRCGLHYLAGRAQEKLTYDQQFQLAEMLGYRNTEGQRAVERFMKRHFVAAKHVGDLTRIFCAVMEQEHLKQPPSLGGLWRYFTTRTDVPSPYVIKNGRISVNDLTILRDDPLAMLLLVETGVARALLFHPEALREMSAQRRLIDEPFRSRAETQHVVFRLLTESKDPVRALRRLSETGILERLIPDFGRVIGLMQFNLYHHYTVDEHTILAIETYHQILSGALSAEHLIETEIAQSLPDGRIMTIALLLHDVGKGLPGDHSIVGEGIAKTLCPQLGMALDETERVAWLVREHLTMSDFAQKRDVTDPATIRAFADIVRSPTRLKQLYLLTVCDIRAVGPNVWNGWKAQLLQQLYEETLTALTGEGAIRSVAERSSQARATLRTFLSGWSDAAFEKHCERFYDSYWIGLRPQSHVAHAELLDHGAPDGVAVSFAPSKTRDATRVIFYTTDHPGIFARVTGALALARASVLDARAYTTKDGMALNTFWVQDDDGGAFVEPERFHRLKSIVENTLLGKVLARDALAARRKPSRREAAFDVAPTVVIDNDASDNFTVIETNGRDRVGLLHDLSVALLRENINVFSAIIATYGEHAVDVFYVRDLFGMKLRQKSRQDRVKKALIEALQTPSAATEKRGD